MCPRCGVQQAPIGFGKSRLVAAFLAFFLGSFGVHRFYLGNIALGIVYLLFFWTAIPGFIAWLEMFYFLTRSDEDWARTYGGPVTQPNGVGLGCAWILALLPFISVVLLILGGFVLADGLIDILSELNAEVLSSVEAGN
jgi:TM2 domain-containing membrane protein YozV